MGGDIMYRAVQSLTYPLFLALFLIAVECENVKLFLRKP